MNFFAELKRRNVIRMAGLYLVGALLLTQVAGTVLPMFGAPDWLPRSIVILLAIGFLPALIFSWVFELTPQGLKRDEDVAPEESIAPQTARRMDRMIIAVLALALGYFGFDKFVLGPRREAAILASVQKLDASPTAAKPGAVISDKSIAVLPFINMSEDKDANAFFADGMHEDILTNLAFIRDLHVVSRTSVMQYRNTTKSINEIASELKVAYLLEGSVRRAGNKVRVTGQLIRAETDEHVWASSYDRDISDVFAIQAELSKSIAGALQAVLSPETKALLERRPTDSPAAYDAYLRARQLGNSGDYFDARAMVVLLRRAVELDPKFAAAWAELAKREAFIFFKMVQTPAQLALAKTAIDLAVQLAPEDPAVIKGLGYYYYYGHRDYSRGRTAPVKPE